MSKRVEADAALSIGKFRTAEGIDDVDKTNVSPSPSQDDPSENSIFKFDSNTPGRTDSPYKFDKKDRDKIDKRLSGDRSPMMDRRASKHVYKAKKQSYKLEKKRVAREINSALKDPAIIILQSWLKVRGSLKGWAKFWCVVKPGLLILYKSSKRRTWVGTILLNGCEVIERPSRKDGFCFKIYHPLEHYIWSARGPKAEMTGSIVMPLPKDHLILRADTESDGKCWIDALEVAIRQGYSSTNMKDSLLQSELYGPYNKEDEEAQDHDDEVSNDPMDKSDSEPEGDEIKEPEIEPEDENEPIVETSYVMDETEEYLGQEGEATEEMEDDNKSILWALLKQVKPGMDLSRVTLPTFILEPRSFLDKLSDYYYHADIIASASLEDNAYERMKEVVRWYLSGFYKKPKGLKKPYNPIIGEMFRCCWQNPSSGARTFFVSEQVSHHPPVSAFYISNRKDGYCINGSILCKSKFYGNSSSAILDGVAVLTLLGRGEEYILTMPYVNCKGILIGTLTMELGGVVTICCEKTGYTAELEFKLKPFWKKSGESNEMTGKIKLGKETLCKLEGKWDGEIVITDYKNSTLFDEEPLPEMFFEPTSEVKAKRLKRQVVQMSKQFDNESDKLWQFVAVAIRNADQENATNEKFKLEEAQREGHRQRKEQNVQWIPKLFERDPTAPPDCVNRWIYKFRDVRPWDPMTDLYEYENDGVIKTRTRMKTPAVKASSVMNIPMMERDGKVTPKSKRKTQKSRGSKLSKTPGGDERSGASTPDPEAEHSSSIEDEDDGSSSKHDLVDVAMLEKTIQPLKDLQKDCIQQMRSIRSDLRRHYQAHSNDIGNIQWKDWVLLFLIIMAQGLFLKYSSR